MAVKFFGNLYGVFKFFACNISLAKYPYNILGEVLQQSDNQPVYHFFRNEK
jgi:hypothetical protein